MHSTLAQTSELQLFHIMLLDADRGDGGQQEERRGRLAERQGGVICIIVKHVVAVAGDEEDYRNSEQRAAYAQRIYKYEPRGRVHTEHPADYFFHMQHLKAILRDGDARFKLYILPLPRILKINTFCGICALAYSAARA